MPDVCDPACDTLHNTNLLNLYFNTEAFMNVSYSHCFCTLTSEVNCDDSTTNVGKKCSIGQRITEFFTVSDEFQLLKQSIYYVQRTVKTHDQKLSPIFINRSPNQTVFRNVQEIHYTFGQRRSFYKHITGRISLSGNHSKYTIRL